MYLSNTPNTVIKYKYEAWNLIKYKYTMFIFLFANTITYLTPDLLTTNGYSHKAVLTSHYTSPLA